MDRLITGKDLDTINPVVRMAFLISYPDGLTMQQLRDSEYGWLRAIYDHIKKREVEAG